ncbi:MerR family transcriptional regulator [Neorickettsia sennetsu]|nr:MerR family transcriptional regulator [Neorickettsia sennetsu]
MFCFEKGKLYYSIREVAEIIGLKEYVLRYWETQFPETLKPKRQSGKRLYTQSDIKAIQKIQELLHKRGMTIRGARSALEGDPNQTELEMATEHLRSLRDFLTKFAKD